MVVYFDQVEVPVPLRRAHDRAFDATLEVVFQGCQNDGICYPPMTRQVTLDLPAAAADQLVSLAAPDADASAPFGVARWLKALLFALGGGLILNLMPCVLPVLSLKALSLAQSGESAGKARAHALWYTAGVLLSFARWARRWPCVISGWRWAGASAAAAAGRGCAGLSDGAIGLSLSGVFSIGSAGPASARTSPAKGPAGISSPASWRGGGQSCTRP